MTLPSHRSLAHHRPPLVLAPFDAELFGHWWFEGPWWLEAVLREQGIVATRREAQTIHYSLASGEIRAILQTLQKIEPGINEGVYAVLTPAASVASRSSYGGAAPARCCSTPTTSSRSSPTGPLRWVARAAEEGSPAPRKQGRPAGKGPLADHLDYLVAAVEANAVRLLGHG